MKKSQLRKIILEELKGYSKYVPGGVTKGGTTDDFHQILTTIAKSGQEEEDHSEDMNENSEEKTYEVSYEFRTGRYGDDIDGDTVEVQATSEEEAIEKVKKDPIKYNLPRLILQSSFRAKVK